MYLTHLSLTNFRNFARLDVAVPPGPLLLVGANAQGKTSFLEAIYFLATLTSFHANNERQMVNFLAGREPLAVARIVGTFRRGEQNHRLEIRIIQESDGYNGASRMRKEALLDGTKLKVNEVIGQFNAVLFLPQMLSIIEGAPEERRRYLNLVISQVQTHYPESLSEYTRAVSQRNALLKQINERGGDESQLDYWDEKMSTSGSRLIQARIRAIQELEQQAVRIHHELTRGDEVLRLVYQPAYDPLPQQPGQFALPIDTPLNRSHFTLEQIRDGLRQKLVAQRNADINRGVTTLGPHRDELRFLENGIDLGTYGSRGQVRTAMLALKMAEVTWIKAKTGQWPALLLDEVLAELDEDRRADLLARLASSEQTMLTTTDLDLFSTDFIQKASLWRVQGGRVTEDLARRT